MSLCIHAQSRSLFLRLEFLNFPVMQLPSVQSNIVWLLLLPIAMAASPLPGGLTRIGTGQLSLLTPNNLSTTSIGRMTYCKRPDDPDQFTSSLNYTFPRTPSISESSLRAAGIDPNDDTYSFDCFLEIPPAGVVTFEVR